jgi:NADPH:quinone reductase-like Zn-dependent oxidoreductase
MPTLPPTYKAFVYEEYDPIEDVVKIKEVPMEPLEATAVRIKVHCAALNPADGLIAEGAGPRFFSTLPSADKPHRLGFDAAGVIVEVGSQAANKFQVGDEVYAMAPFLGLSTLAEYVTLDADCVARKPNTLDFAKAAAVPAVALTSYQALINHAKLQKDDRILILGGSTSVGMYAIQHAKMIGAYVIATASTKKVEFLKTLGADEVIDYTTTQWSDVIVPHSLDVVFECAGDSKAWDGDAQVVLKKEGSRFITVLPGPPASDPKFGATHTTVFCRQLGADLVDISPSLSTMARFSRSWTRCSRSRRLSRRWC